MEDNNDKLDDFFRMQLQSESGGEDHWDQPDPQVWQQAQAILNSAAAQEQRRFAFWPWILLVSLLLGSLVTYILILQQTNVDLRENLAQQQQGAISHQQEMQLLTEKYQARIIALEEELISVKKESGRKIASVQKQIKNLQKTTDQEVSAIAWAYDQKIRDLSRELGTSQKTLQGGIVQNEDARPEQAPTQDNSLAQWGFLPELAGATSLGLPLSSPRMEAQVIVLGSAANKREQIKNWEMGIRSGRALQTNHYVANFGERVRTEALRSDLSSSAVQIALAYSPKTNWWVSSGVRLLQIKGESSFKIGTEYDKSKEFLDDEGRKANALTLETVSYLQSNRYAVRISNPTDVELEDKEIITGELIHRQHTQFWQIPLEVEYRRQIRKWGWQAHAGPVLTYQFDKENAIEGRLEALQRVLTLEVSEDKAGGAKSALFLGFVGGLGLTYQLGAAVVARMDVIGQVNRKSFQPLAQIGLGFQF